MNPAPDGRPPASAAMFDRDDPLMPVGTLCPEQADPPERDPPRPFTPELMAAFCEKLAECGMVHRAAEAVGFSRNTIYRHRRNNPSFAAAWDAALGHARQRLADFLLERAIEGSFDFTYQNGELVGHRHYLDSRLAYAMLCRLDRDAGERDAAGQSSDDRAARRFDDLVAAIHPTAAVPPPIPATLAIARPSSGGG